MHPIRPNTLPSPVALHGTQATRAIETAVLGPVATDALMRQAGAAVARWARALYPHTRRVWVLCGPGHNGVDGLWAAIALQQSQPTGHGHSVWVTLHSAEGHGAATTTALLAARAAGVTVSLQAPSEPPELVIDALLGIGSQARVGNPVSGWMQHLFQTEKAPVLCVDLPSGLNADTGQVMGLTQPPPMHPPGPRHTLSLLTLKPGLFTGQGRTWAGDIWWHDLGVNLDGHRPDAWLNGMPTSQTDQRGQRHDTHKGSYGNVLVIGGEHVAAHGQGMTGAAVLAGRAALHSGTGRVWLGLLGPKTATQPSHDPLFPELMFHTADSLLASERLQDSVTVCGCGAGAGVARVLPQTLEKAAHLVLDADALNAIAADRSLLETLRERESHCRPTVLTPHPLEAARLLECSVAAVQQDRLTAAQRLAESCHCVVVLKGSGTIVAAPGHTPFINPTGNALLATAGTGDVLAGLLAGIWAQNANACPTASGSMVAWRSALQAVHRHGAVADRWTGRHMGASGLVSRL